MCCATSILVCISGLARGHDRKRLTEQCLVHLGTVTALNQCSARCQAACHFDVKPHTCLACRAWVRSSQEWSWSLRHLARQVLPTLVAGVTWHAKRKDRSAWPYATFWRLPSSAGLLPGNCVCVWYMSCVGVICSVLLLWSKSEESYVKARWHGYVTEGWIYVFQADCNRLSAIRINLLLSAVVLTHVTYDNAPRIIG